VLSQHLAHLQHPSSPITASITLGKKNSQPAESKIRAFRWQRLSISLALVVLVCMAVSVGLAEATGMTHLSATVIRILTPDGTLVVEVTDPGVKVTIEGDGGLTITRAGLEEIRLRPGNYRVHADKDGKPVPLERELVSINRGGREVVKVKLDGKLEQVPARIENGAFVLLAAGKEHTFDNLSEAVQAACDGDTIEVRGNGPFVIEPIPIENVALTIRAAAGYRPVMRLGPLGLQTIDCMLTTSAPLVLEGLEFQRLGQKKDVPPAPGIVTSHASLYVANCRFRFDRGPTQFCLRTEGPVFEMRNNEFLGPECFAATAYYPKCQRCEINNCIQIGGLTHWMQYKPNTHDVQIHVSHNTLLCSYSLSNLWIENLPQPGDEASRPLALHASGNVIETPQILGMLQWDRSTGNGKQLDLDDSLPLLPRLLTWHDMDNLFAVGSHYLSAGVGDADTAGNAATTLAAWKEYWKEPGANLLEGRVRLQGGNVASRLETAPQALTPEDFRLRPDCPGYRAGPDGKDLGADVDLVGPGEAYERWKKTLDYQQWLIDSGQRKDLATTDSK
jgi:hypothetical protein